MLQLFQLADLLYKYDLGVPFVLELQDESPFMKFGYVYPGQTIPAVYNNLIRAPLFRHKPYHTDFLVVRFDYFLPMT
jgi:transcription initiation factor TFIID subunit 1